MIEYRKVVKSYNDVEVVRGIDLTIRDGEFVVLIGPSGCGKTTTLKMLNRLIEPNSGEILIDGQNVKQMNPERLRTSIGYVIQQIGLFPNMTVEENICVVPKLLKWDKKRCHERVLELLALVNMPYEEYAKKYPNELSGGQQQRIGVLRALAAEPPIILMDEPFGALDPITRDTLQDEVKALQKRLRKTIIFVTHDMNEAIKMADTIVFMDRGVIQQIAPPEEMLRAPANDTVREFMGKHVASVGHETDLLSADVMRKKIAKVSNKWRTLECVEMMSRLEIDSLIVVDDEERFEGIVTIEAINEHGAPGESVTKILTRDVPTVQTTTPAKEAFEQLLERKSSYLVVLDEQRRVAGIITRTSMSKALASVVWGGKS
ncbi:ABC transporter ATP-binding protein [Feifania hominis]|uniref:Quaternary amine transport ATP-binding protein n=1 Tax=Feifania hominis TaxID=2763660 RepID=A0A926HT19_9FIRM|nr:ABC transporter ATP-binding protein [Feifania hominis]MBC8535399.1 ABC transporter ATP-binding protein [Feifania hominis]